MGFGKSCDESFIIIDFVIIEINDIWVLDVNNLEGEFSVLMLCEEGYEFDVDKLGDIFYIVINW